MRNILRKSKYFKNPLAAPSSKLQAASFGLVEVVIGVSILGVGFGLLFGIAFASVRLATDATIKIQVALLLEEGAEAIRMLRDTDDGWTTFFTDSDADNVERCLLSVGSSFDIDDSPGFAGQPVDDHWTLVAPAHAQGLQQSEFVADAVGSAQYNGASVNYLDTRSGNGNDHSSLGSLYFGLFLGNYAVTRSLLNFDTSNLPDTAVIDAVTLEIYETVLTTAGVPIFSVSVTEWTDATDGIENEDYQKYTTLDGPVVYGSATPAAGTVSVVFTNFTTAINKTGFTGLMLRATNELNPSNPPTAYQYITFNNSTNKPKLIIQYHDAGASQIPMNCGIDFGGITVYRTINIGPACRDGSANITTAGYLCQLSVDDPETRRISISVYWNQRGTIKRESLETYLTNR
ncbi:MAG: DNRLRE domain-containing protein [Patescibacteria group bacterium]